MGGENRVNPEAEATIVHGYRSGERVIDIAACAGVSLGTIYDVLRRCGQRPDR